MRTHYQHATRLPHALLSTFILLAAFFSTLPFVQAQPTFFNDESPPQFETLAPASLTPHPVYAPDEIIRFQLEALARNNIPYDNAGVELVFRFASPSHRERTGPLRRFTRIVYNPLYRPLVNHQFAHYGELLIDGDKAHQLVVLTDSDGDRVSYVFTLSRQAGGEYDQCWMTDSVLLLPGFHDV